MNKKRWGAIWIVPEEEFRQAIANSETNTEALAYFGLLNKGGNNRSLKERIAYLNIDISHFNYNKSREAAWIKRKVTLEYAKKNIFIKNGSNNRNSVKRYLKQFNLLPYICAECNLINEWNNKPLVLHLEHKNGISNDHRLENLSWLCPNCHSQTETFAGRNLRKPIKETFKGKDYFCKCGNKISSWGKQCCECASKNKEKIKWPDKETLIKLVWLKPCTIIAKEIGVSDKAIEKRCKKLGISKPPRGYWEKFKNNKI